MVDRTPSAQPVPWWRDAVVYQIYPRSFRDLSGDGVGDLAGIRAGLDHLVSLGVDALWISPIFPSPMADFGYDVADFTDVDPLFGSLEELDALIAEAHHRGMRVLLDLVPNHTSEQHPWFLEAGSARDAPKRDWYVWRDPAPDGGPPNNWVAAFPADTPAWTFHEGTGQYYLHLFLKEQPDLDWSNPEVVAAMHDVVRFWLDRGIDGFRVDVVHLIGKHPALADDGPELAGLPRCILHHDDETHPLLKDLRALFDSYPGDRVFIGETALWDSDLVATYYGDDDELHLAFNFVPTHTSWDAAAWRAAIELADRTHRPRGAWPTWILSNHDVPRHRTRYGGSEARARAAAVLLLTLRGTPFVFAGEELGLDDADVPSDRRLDPGGRDGERAPIPWSPEADHGWAGAAPWLPWPPEPDSRNVATQAADPDSILGLYRRLLAARRASTALRRGEQQLLDCPDGVLGLRRSTADDVDRVVYVNFTSNTVRVEGGGTVEVATGLAGEGRAFDGALGPDEAVVVRVD